MAPDQGTDNDWYGRSWIHSHISLGLSPSGLDFIGSQITAAVLDAVQFHCTGGSGLWDAVRKARLDEKLDFKMVATINKAGSYHRKYEKDPAYVQRIHPDGNFAGRWDRRHLCFNAPVVRERVILKSYKVLPARLKPDQVWIDELFDYESESPKLVGKGRSLYLCDDLFGLYSRHSGYAHKPKGEDAALRARVEKIFKDFY